MPILVLVQIVKDEPAVFLIATSVHKPIQYVPTWLSETADTHRSYGLVKAIYKSPTCCLRDIMGLLLKLLVLDENNEDTLHFHKVNAC